MKVEEKAKELAELEARLMTLQVRKAFLDTFKKCTTEFGAFTALQGAVAFLEDVEDFMNCAKGENDKD